MELSIRLDGTKEVIENLHKKIAGSYVGLKEAVTKGALNVERDAKKWAIFNRWGTSRHRPTRRLNTSITHQIIDNPAENEISARVGTNVEYSPYVEFGTGTINANYPEEAKQYKGRKTIKGQRKQPYLYPAYASNIELINQAIVKAIKQAIEK